MLFRTVVPLTCPAHVDPLRHADQLTLIGSCFSEGVGQRLQDCGHRALINPLGTIFNPVSLARVVALLASGEEVLESDLEYCDRQQHYFSFEAGTSMVGEDASSCAEKLTEAIGAGRTALSQSKCLFLTLGSAWAYVRPGSGPVANCRMSSPPATTSAHLHTSTHAPPHPKALHNLCPLAYRRSAAPSRI